MDILKILFIVMVIFFLPIKLILIGSGKIKTPKYDTEEKRHFALKLGLRYMIISFIIVITFLVITIFVYKNPEYIGTAKHIERMLLYIALLAWIWYQAIASFLIYGGKMKHPFFDNETKKQKLMFTAIFMSVWGLVFSIFLYFFEITYFLK